MRLIPRTILGWVCALALLGGAGLGGYFLLSKSFLTREVVLSQLGVLLGGTIEAKAVRVDTSGVLVIEDATLRVPGVPGEAAEAFTVRKLTAHVELGSVLSGTPVVRRVELDGPVARISQSVDDRSVNLAGLKVRSMGGGGKLVVPVLVVRDGVIELGEHVTDPSKLAALPAGTVGYTALKRFGVEGEMQRAEGVEAGDMFVSFRQTPPGGDSFVGPLPLTLSGVVNEDAVTVELGSVPLSGWEPQTMPAPLRRVLEEMKLEGGITGAELTYRFEGGLAARIGFSGVAVSLPIEPQPGETRDGEMIPVPAEHIGKRLRMSGVNGYVSLDELGKVQGQMAGMVEGLPYDVSFEATKADPNSAFTLTISARDVAITSSPEILKFAPGVARLRLAQFDNPTGVIDTTIVVTRGEPVDGKPAAVRARGEMNFRNAVVAFERFPYRFTNMAGRVTFDDERIVIHSIHGSAPGGVIAEASGVIAPPTGEAGVEINVKITNLPMDERLGAAMLHRAKILDELMNRTAYDMLVREGVLDPKEFQLGGRANVVAKVTRKRGGENLWNDTIIIDVPEANLLPRRFPYPIIANGLHIEKVDDLATLTEGTGRGLRGGNARVAARVDLAKIEAAEGEFVPDIEVSATDVPLEPLLWAGLPRPDSLGGEDVLRQKMVGLGLTGKVNVEARIAQNAANEAGYTIDITPAGVDAKPVRTLSADELSHVKTGGERERRMEIRQIEGSLRVTEKEVDADLRARVGVGGGSTPIAAKVRMDAESVGTTAGFEINATGEGVELERTFEDLIGVFAPEVGARMDGWRTQYAPGGTADMRVQSIRKRGEEGVSTRIDLPGRAAVSWAEADGRVQATQTAGALVLSIESGRGEGRDEVVAECAGFEATISMGTETPTTLVADGTMSSLKGVVKPVRLTARGGRFESPVTRLGLSLADASGVRRFLETRRVAGGFDLDLSLSPGAMDRAQISGSVTPRDISLLIEDRPVSFRTDAGVFEFGGTDMMRARARGLRLAATDWTIDLDGTILKQDDGTIATHADVTLDAARLSPDLCAVLPRPAREAIEGLLLRVDGPLKLTRTPVSVTFGPDGEVGAFKLDMHATASDVALDVGSQIDQATGAIDMVVERDSAGAPARFELWALLDSFRFAGVAMTSGRVRASGESDGKVLVPHVSADCYGGRVAGHAELEPTAQGGGRPFTVEIQTSDVRFAPMLRDLKAARPDAKREKNGGGADVAGDADDVDGSRGLLDASMSISGVTGDADSRRGRGSATIGGGRVLSLPVVVPLIRATNLQLPVDEKLDFASAEFFLIGDQISFEQMTISSPGVDIYGYGTCGWPSTVLDLRFRPRARTRIPLLSGVMENIRNELISATASGTLDNPEINVRTFSGTRRLLGGVLGQEPGEQELKLDAIERAARRDPRLARPAEREAVDTGSPR